MHRSAWGCAGSACVALLSIVVDSLGHAQVCWIVIDLVGLSWVEIVSRARWLRESIPGIAVLGSVLIKSGQLVGLNHRQHLAETLADPCDSLSRVPEGQFAPRHEVNPLAIQIGEAFLTTGAREAAQVLLIEHGVLIRRLLLTLCHKEVVQVLQLALEKLQGFLCFCLVCELLGQRSDDVVQSAHDHLLKLDQPVLVSLVGLQLPNDNDPVGNVTLVLIHKRFKARSSILQLSDLPIVDCGRGTVLRHFQVRYLRFKGAVLLLKLGDSIHQFGEIGCLEVVEL